MKLLIFLLLVLETFPLATTALPLFTKSQKTLANSPPRTPPSSVNSFDSTSSLSSGSGSDRDSKKPSFLSKITSSQSSTFRCYRPSDNSVLSELSTYITDLLRSYRESLWEKGGQDGLSFEQCYAGYESSDVSPSIFLGNMKATQKELVGKLLKNHFKIKFPDVKIVKTSNAIAVVMGKLRGIRRRNTV
ncbi:hypothetical protein BDR22DRAFT_529612 [Usnea florida]